MSQNVALKVKLFSAFSHLIRLQILEELRRGERCVSKLVKLIKDASQPQVSNHPICLCDCGLVNSRKEWRKVYYSFADLKVAELLKVVEDILPRFLRRLKDVSKLKGVRRQHA
ncbi:helix-turn-helix transcriptional regulator [Candidatus Bathyarchaeota archaeon]|nr:helix-turn-helix transcriptional regulator [Candidatus Bathyarchaeota archaeon]